jgi:hypothetical protein
MSAKVIKVIKEIQELIAPSLRERFFVAFNYPTARQEIQAKRRPTK